VAVFIVVVSIVVVRVVGNWFYGGADGVVGGLIAVKLAKWGIVGAVAIVAAVAVAAIYRSVSSKFFYCTNTY